MGIRNAATTVLLLVSIATLSFGPVRVLAEDGGGGVDCEWKYKCELVLQREPFICGQWASEAEKICPQQQQEATTSAPEPAAEEEDVGSFRPFHMIKAPCLAPHVSDRQGRCRLPFA